MNVRNTNAAPLVMSLGAAFLVTNDAVVKSLSGSLAVADIIFFRSIAIVAVCSLLLVGKKSRRPVRLNRDVSIRTFFTIANVFAFVAAISVLPFAVTVLLDFSAILFVAVLSPFLLNEQFSVLRMVYVCIGFVGAYLILAPQFSISGFAVLLPLLSGLMGAGRDLWTRKLAHQGPSPATLTLYASLCMVFVSLFGLSQNPLTVSMPDAGGAMLAGSLQAAAFILMAKAYMLAEAGHVAPFRLTSLIWTVLIGFFVFEESYSLQQILGASAVIASLILCVLTIPASQRRSR